MKKPSLLETVSEEGKTPLQYAFAIQDTAAQVGFDWPDATGAVEKLLEELHEVLDVCAQPQTNPEALFEEVGDLLYAVVNVARKLHVDPTAALQACTHKFIRRFKKVESLAHGNLRAFDLETLEAFWQEAKKEE